MSSGTNRKERQAINNARGLSAPEQILGAPVLVTKEPPGSLLLPADAPFAAVGASTDPTIVSRTRAIDSTAGTTLVQSIQGYSTPTALSDWKVEDGVARKLTVFVAPGPIYPGQVPGVGTPASNLGLYVRVTYGTGRASVSRWVATPCELQVEGSYVRVDANIGILAYCLGTATGTAGSSSGGAPLSIGTGASPSFCCSVMCGVVEGHSDVGPSMLLTPNGALNPNNPPPGGIQCGFAAGPQLPLTASGYLPAILDSVVLTNTGAVAVAMCGFDGPAALIGGYAPRFQRTPLIYVPATSTVSVGSALLGAWFANVTWAGVTPPPRSGATDTNDANVYVAMYGRVLNPSPGGG